MTEDTTPEETTPEETTPEATGSLAAPQAAQSHGVLSRLYHGETTFNIVGRWKLWFGVSGALLLIGMAALFTRGLNLGIDFTGGTVWEVPAGNADVTEVEQAMGDLGYDDVQVQEITLATGSSDERTLRVEAEATATPTAETVAALDAADAGLTDIADSVKGDSAKALNNVRSQLSGIEGPFADDVPEPLADIQTRIDDFPSDLDGADDATAFVSGTATAMQGDVDALAELEQANREEVGQAVSDKLAELTGSDVAEVTVDTVGPSWGKQVSQKAETALVVFLIAILLYITLRFEFRMALATVVALMHDLLIVIGLYALFQFPVTPATVIAVLTILGFSIYDGIVVFDRVDENTKLLGRKAKITYSEMANLSLNQVLMRSLNTSITALLPILTVLVLGSFVLGATTLEEFGLALFLGLLSGAYSSIFIATPLLAILKEREPRWTELRERLAERGGASAAEPELATAGVGSSLADSPVSSGPLVTPRPRKKGKR